jgi:flagellar protein FlgJ
MGRTLDHVNWRRAQPLPTALAKYLKANFLQISETGIYNDRNVAGTNKKSSHAEGRALDIHLSVHRPDEKLIADQLYRIFVEAAHETGIDNVIWNRKIWSRARGQHGYHGQNPHTDHIHIEFTRPGSQLTVWHLLDLKVAQLRTGLEELSRAQANIG